MATPPGLPQPARKSAWDIWTFGGYRTVRCTWCGNQVTHRDTPEALALQAVWAETHEKDCSERLLNESQRMP